jgi:hypothetical protein
VRFALFSAPFLLKNEPNSSETAPFWANSAPLFDRSSPRNFKSHQLDDRSDLGYEVNARGRNHP